MRFDVLTLFPHMFEALKDYGVVGRAQKGQLIDINTVHIRDFSKDKHQRVDDEVYGGGCGMLMTPQPIVDAMRSVSTARAHRIYLSPQGAVLTQKRTIELSHYDHLILLCGHYEGVDNRVVEHFIDEELSMGDYVLTGGELPAMVLIDAISRHIPGVLGNETSASTDSHYDRLLQYPQYTRPRDFEGHTVPEVLCSGNHRLIDEWRKTQSLEVTKNKRPDLLDQPVEDREY